MGSPMAMVGRIWTAHPGGFIFGSGLMGSRSPFIVHLKVGILKTTGMFLVDFLLIDQGVGHPLATLEDLGLVAWIEQGSTKIMVVC
ncbi:hypothetical protein U1Q18_040555 [Sarracenia purpurea var. burkii]